MTTTFTSRSGNRRIQVFDIDGKFPGANSIDVPVDPNRPPRHRHTSLRDHRHSWSPASLGHLITPRPNQVLYSSDVFPRRIYKLSSRKSARRFGKSGRQLGQFGWVHETPALRKNSSRRSLNWRVQETRSRNKLTSVTTSNGIGKHRCMAARMVYFFAAPGNFTSKHHNAYAKTFSVQA